MAVINGLLYSAGITMILGSIFVLKYIDTEDSLTKLVLYIPMWVGGRREKLNLQVSSGNDIPPTPKYSSKWWTGGEQFQLERRAIFSKSWLFVTHASRFQKPGDYRSFEIAGFSFIVILGKDKQLRTFHNVCRHRAYAVTKKESGSSTVLGCRYHGWSYDTEGKLIKAPEFEDVAGFEKAMNGLWELKTDIQQGIVFVNFEVGNSTLGVAVTELRNTMRSWKIGDMKWEHEWKLEGAFNWKLADSFFSTISGEESSWAGVLPGIFRARSQTVVLCHTTVLRRLKSGRLLILRVLPLSPNKTLIECNIYGESSRYTRTTQLELESTKKEVEVEVKAMELQQESLLNGSCNFQSHRQDELSGILGRHDAAEKVAGEEIHPAARKQSFTQEGMADDELCKELEVTGRDTVCGASARGLLDW